MKPLALVKLAAQCADYYHEAQKQLQRDALRGLFDKEWTNTVTGKALGLSALAQYHQAMANADSKDIGWLAFIEFGKRLGSHWKYEKFILRSCLKEVVGM